MRLPICAPLFAIVASAAGAAAPALEDLDMLDARIAVFLGGTAADAGQRAQPVDRRLRLLRCTDAVALEPPVMGAVTASCPSRGWRLRVMLAGSQVSAPPELVIRRGDAVELAYLGAGFDVRTTATAVEDGRAGGVVRVKSTTGAAVVTARVRGPGAVAIND